jgi:pilus assembly protein CpaB
MLMVLLVALTAGSGLAYATYNYLQNVPVETVEVPTQPVVVAQADLFLGSELKASDLRLVDWPVSLLPDGTFDDMAQLAGRGLVRSVIRHEPILQAKLAAEGAGAGLPPIIPPGMRAVSLRVNEVIGVAGYVLPGTHVDVLATASPTNRVEDTMTKLVLADVEVLTAGTRLERDMEDDQPVQVTVVTLLVTPGQSERLSLAGTEGKIQLALRNPFDDGRPETPGVSPERLLASATPTPRPMAPIAAPAPPPPPPPPPPTVEVIRGDTRERAIVR